jgi:hypothetical protein
MRLDRLSLHGPDTLLHRASASGLIVFQTAWRRESPAQLTASGASTSATTTCPRRHWRVAGSLTYPTLKLVLQSPDN